MSKTFVITSALFLGAAAFGLSGGTALAASAKTADAVKRAECEREATLQLYIGEQRSRWIRQCVASSGRSPDKPVALRPSVHPSARTAMPRVTPLGGSNPRTSTGNTAPSNAPVRWIRQCVASSESRGS
jgi:hypothetical protein